ncbi:MAG: hypothetical protein B6I25_03245 [Planctomycetales bacterium 4572_13]|nr:MAG: hypothetical protein B6I25_03245 [Planctomycetales bacterium 4572_13]
MRTRLASIETDQRAMATVLELCNETWMHTVLSEHPINRRTRVARLFPNEASLLRLVSAIEMEISEDWIAGKRYLEMQTEMENENESANSKEKRIYRKNVA